MNEKIATAYILAAATLVRSLMLYGAFFGLGETVSPWFFVGCFALPLLAAVLDK